MLKTIIKIVKLKEPNRVSTSKVPISNLGGLGGGKERPLLLCAIDQLAKWEEEMSNFRLGLDSLCSPACAASIDGLTLTIPMLKILSSNAL